MKAGDDLLTLAGQPLGSIADVQWVLHNFPDDGGPLQVEVERPDGAKALTMKLEPDWRRTEDFGWRYRVAGYASWLWAGVSFEDTPSGILVANRSPNWFKKPNRDARRAFEARRRDRRCGRTDRVRSERAPRLPHAGEAAGFDGRAGGPP